MPETAPDFQLRAVPHLVEMTVLAHGTVRAVDLSPPLARRLANNLVLFAERAEQLGTGQSGDFPREGTVVGDGPSEDRSGPQKP
jgi:hypothetical protein